MYKSPVGVMKATMLSRTLAAATAQAQAEHPQV
jgi:hypothetical protein